LNKIVELAKKELDEAGTRYAPLTEQDQAKILALADDLPAV